MSDNILIPTPIAPARPITTPIGTTTPMTYSIGGQTGSGVIDSQGNIFDGSGKVVQSGAGNSNGTSSKSIWQTIWGAVSIPNFPTLMTPEAQADANAKAQAATDAAKKEASTLVNFTLFGLSLIDAVAIAVGLILIIGALYTFSGTKDIITTATKAATAAV